MRRTRVILRSHGSRAGGLGRRGFGERIAVDLDGEILLLSALAAEPAARQGTMPGAVASLINEVGELNWPLWPFTGGFCFWGGGGVTEEYGLGGLETGGLQGI
jgi:hypothetical protein